MKLNSSKAIAISLSALALGQVGLVSANQISHSNKTNLKVPSSDSIINPDTNKVNYVTFGDSLSAGFTDFDNKMYNHIDYRSSDHNMATHKIYGDAYSAWVARALQKDNILGSYDNFAVSGFTSGNILHQLDKTSKLDANDIAHFNYVTDNGKYDSWLSKSDWDNYYNNDNYIDSTIKRANLVNITLGGNDIIWLMKIMNKNLDEWSKGGISAVLKALEEITSDDFDINKVLSIDEKDLTNTLLNLKNNIKGIIKFIKNINPNAKIMVMGYVFSMEQLRGVFGLEQNDKHVQLLESVFSSLNKMIKSCTIDDRNIDFIAIDNRKTEFLNNINKINIKTPRGHSLKLKDYNTASWYTPIASDVHPGPYGYRLIASKILRSLIGQDNNNNNDPKNLNPLVDNSVARLDIDDNFTDMIKSFENTSANLNNYLTFEHKKPVSYLQPQIAALDNVGPAGTGDISVSYKWNRVAMLTNNFNHLLSSIKDQMTIFASTMIKNDDPIDVKTFKNNYRLIDGPNVSFQEMIDFGKLKEDVSNPKNLHVSDNKYFFLNYAVNSKQNIASLVGLASSVDGLGLFQTLLTTLLPKIDSTITNPDIIDAVTELVSLVNPLNSNFQTFGDLMFRNFLAMQLTHVDSWNIFYIKMHSSKMNILLGGFFTELNLFFSLKHGGSKIKWGLI